MAAGDLALQATLLAIDQMSPVVASAAANFDASIGSMDSSAAGLDASFATIDAAMAEMSSMTAENAAAASALDASLSSIDAAASGADAALATLSGTANSVDAAMSSIDSSASAADSALSSSSGEASGLEGVISGLADTITALAGRMDTLSGSIDAVSGELANIGSSAREAGAGAEEARGMFSGFGGGLSDIGMKGMMLYANFMMVKQALEAVGSATVGAAGDFEEGLTQLVTGAGEAESNINMVGQGILQMSVDTGESTKQLEQGMYMIESAGEHGAAGLDVLKVAAEGAQVGNAQLETVANALTTTLTDYHMPATQAAEAMNALTVTVASGKTHLQDLATAMGNVLPLASSLHITFPQVAGALAVMTNAGMDARRSSMNLANAIRALAAPSATATKAMQAVGLSAKQVSDTLTHQGLQQTLQLIETHLDQKFPQGSAAWTAAAKNIMGGATGLNVALMLGGKNMGAYESNIKNISAAMKNGGSSVTGWAKVQGDFNTQMNQAKAVLADMGIQIGEKLMPYISQAASAFMHWITTGGHMQMIMGLVSGAITGVVNTIKTLVQIITTLVNIGTAVVQFFQKNQWAADLLIAVLIGIGAAILVFVATMIPALVAAFIAWAVAAGAAAIATLAAAAPFILIGVIIAAVVFGIIMAIQHWGQIVAWLKGVWGAVAGWFGSIFSAIGTTVHNAVTGIGNWFSWLGTQAHQKWTALVNGIMGIVNGVKTWLSNIWQNIVNTVVGWFSWLYNHNYYFRDLVEGIKLVFNNAKQFITNIWNTIVTWLTDKWNGLKNTVGNIFSAIGTFIHDKLTGILNINHQIWNAIGTFIHDKIMALAVWLYNQWESIKNNVVSKVTNLKNLVGNAFSDLGTLVHQKITDLWNWLTGFIGGWPAKAFQWGVNLITGFINGIKNMVGGVINAVSNIAGTIGHFLGFHSPTKEGPGKDADKWAPAFINMYVAGLKAGMPRVNAAFAQLLTPNAKGFALSSTSAGQNGPFTTMNLEIKLDNRVLAEAVGVQMAKEVRINGRRNA